MLGFTGRVRDRVAWNQAIYITSSGCAGSLLSIWHDFMKNPRPTPRCFGVERVGRGYEHHAWDFNREPGVFAIAVGEFFVFRPDWHRDDRAGPLVRQYQLTLDAILRDQPGLASCAVACRHCGIRFLTHPRNANRRDLCCPFGCRQHHRRAQANARSRKHYCTEGGRRNKKLLNGKRSQAGAKSENGAPPDTAAEGIAPSASPVESARQPPPDPAGPPTRVDLHGPAYEEATLTLSGFTLREATVANSPLLPYLAMVATVLEGRAIRREELLIALQRSMRQRSIDRLPRREYVLGFLEQHPP